MRHSEFWRAVDAVHGSVYGRSLARDLVLGGIGMSAEEALAAGVGPRQVWDALCDDTDTPEEDRWVYREDPRERRR